MRVLGIDVGGTYTKVGLVENGQITERYEVKTDCANLFKPLVQKLPRQLWKKVDLVGISIPGFIDHQKAIVTWSGNLRLKNYDVVKHFRAAAPYSGKVYVLNDANAATLGEFWRGAGANYDSIIFYTIGTGIGGGIVINGQLVYGHQGYAGELGHGGNFQNQVDCTCGLKHCIEPVSSAQGMERALRTANLLGSLREIKKLVGQNPQVDAVLSASLTPLAHHIATMETALNPEAIIIGGGASALGEPFRALLANLVKQNQLDFINRSTQILLAQTENDAGMLGAAFWALDQSKREALWK
ncbi:ROK family protein [Mycoplasma sp. ATU-Cv-703]|uniref:ROK family protein n=1 Tax=Mycoplasma sp. ATU-Cv-703 TaxID=2498595 RepID=UPI000FDE0C55